MTKGDGQTGPVFDWIGWEDEQDEMGLATEDGFTWLTIRCDGEEFATIGHRTCGGKYPLDGKVAKEKERRAQWIVDALNARFDNSPYNHEERP